MRISKEKSSDLISCLIGTLLLCISCVIYVVDPLELSIKKLFILKPGSIFYQLWLNPPYDAYATINVFNATNHEAFLAGKEKLKLQEVGPFTYRFLYRNEQSVFNKNGTISFLPMRGISFVKEQSYGDPDDVRIIFPNLALLAVAASLVNSSIAANMALASYCIYSGCESFLKLTINEYLWGIDDDLIALAHKLTPETVDFERFGALDRLMTIDNNNVLTIATNPYEIPSNDTILTEKELRRYYHIDKYNGLSYNPHWGNPSKRHKKGSNSTKSRCGYIEGSYDGTIFPQDINENFTFQMYRASFCRPLKFIFFKKLKTKDGYNGMFFNISDEALAPPHDHPDTACYCPKTGCLRRGLTTLMPCYGGIPLALSRPHFLNSDPYLLTQIDGLRPEEAKHGSYLALHPKLGIPLEGHIRMQVNVIIGKTKFVKQTSAFNNLVLPLQWFELKIEEIPPVVALTIDIICSVLPVVQNTLLYGFGIIGLIFILFALVNFLSFKASSHKVLNILKYHTVEDSDKKSRFK